MTRPSEEIEREVEAARGDLDRTVDALKDKMSPGQLIDELTRGLKGGSGGEMLNTLGVQARENPMALAMIGAGVAWLMMGRSDGGGSTEPSPYRTPDSASFAPAPQPNDAGGLNATAGRLGEKVSDAVGAAKDGLTDKAEHAVDSLHQIGGKATAAGQDVARSFEAMLQKEPLIVGALGLAVGVALGAALPATGAEDRTFGAARDDLLKAGEAKVAEAAQALKASGVAAIDAVKAEAEQQGLTPSQGDASLVEKADAVLRSGVQAARDELNGDRQA